MLRLLLLKRLIGFADKAVVWKRFVDDVREMCDVCNTTLFNYHWTCGECCFVVCIDCYKADPNPWFPCTHDKSHRKSELMMVQIIPGESLQVLEQCFEQGIAQYSDHSNDDTAPSRTNMQDSGVSYSSQNDGKMLHLVDPMYAGNLKMFQERWSLHEPVVVSNVNLDVNLWRPESFSNDFGDDTIDLLNCVTGALASNQSMKRFWDGFDCFNKRIKDDNGVPMLLKLKDWPPDDDFAKTMPKRFEDLMKSLPLTDYTKRNGAFNLACRLPECFLKPDLGPKMYAAYGSALHPTNGTTNLHLDISDAVNVMVYVSMPKDEGNRDSFKEAYEIIKNTVCDESIENRILKNGELPGALWHIYAPNDACRIRDFLEKVTIERGEMLEPNHDAIHDQKWYLDNELRKRLHNEFQVEGYQIVQFLGDAIFIPAGAPHQVLNLHNCIKVAEDFVSPENLSECMRLTSEIRLLSDTHENHEDKLQAKSILYHSVKDALACLSPIKVDRNVYLHKKIDGIRPVDSVGRKKTTTGDVCAQERKCL